MIREYEVRVEVSYGGSYFETTVTVDAHDAQEAKDIAVEAVDNNLLIIATSAEREDDDE